MGLPRLAKALTILSLTTATVLPADYLESRILYLVHENNLDQALELYNSHAPDYDVLRKMALMILEQGSMSNNHEDLLLTVYGAGIINDRAALPILEKGLDYPNPQVQLAAIHFLSQQQNSQADRILQKALSSDFLLLRLEALYYLAPKRLPETLSQIEALMVKVPHSVQVVFPELLARHGSPTAIKLLARFLNDADPMVRNAAITSVANYKIDTLLPYIRRLASQPSASQKEASLWALGVFDDTKSLPLLKKGLTSSLDDIKIAAALALYRQGDHQGYQTILKLIPHNLFAIYALGEIEGTQEELASLIHHKDLQISYNAACALLQHRDPRCVEVIGELLLCNKQGLAVVPTTSTGKVLSAIKTVYATTSKPHDNAIIEEISLTTKEKILTEAFNLPGDNFITLAETIFSNEQNDLIPATVSLLENMQTPKAVALLEKHHQHLGNPLIRNYCNLALYRLTGDEFYENQLQKWLNKQQDQALIEFRSMVPRNWDHSRTHHQLTPKETSQLLINSYQTLAESHTREGVQMLMEAIVNGNPKNKYALAGLLFIATQ
ncbi:MAG: HEAT repeat domain-containing protein [Chlamydiota bacterium]